MPFKYLIRNKKRKFALIANFLFLFLFFNLLENWTIISEVTLLIVGFQFYLKAFLYLFCYCLCILSISSISIVENNWAAYSFIIYSTATIFIEQSLIQLNGNGLDISDIHLLFSNLPLAGQVVKQYGAQLITPALYAILFFVFSLFIRANHKKNLNFRQSTKPFLYLLLSVILCLSIMWGSNGVRKSFPSPVKTPCLLIYKSLFKLYNGPRADVTLPIEGRPIAQHIVVVVDESIRGDLLEINGGDYPNNPFLKNNQSHYINMGIASSGAICSDYSNIILMSGLRMNEIPDKDCNSLKKPSIFQYAENAGFTTNFIDGQSGEDVPDGFMTPYDFKNIDYRWHPWIEFPKIKKYETDEYSIKILKNIIKSQAKSFSYLIKYGSHFHYEDTYPMNRKIFIPTTEPNDWKKNDKRKLFNSYNNSISWAVDHFFEILTDSLNGEDILIIYTSDHGQNLNEIDGISLTHCLKDKAPSNMAAVPLFIFSPKNTLIEKIKTKYNNELSKNVNKSSHFDIFPTALKLMGYNQHRVDSIYSPSLIDDIPNRERVFSSGDLFERNKNFTNQFNIHTLDISKTRD